MRWLDPLAAKFKEAIAKYPLGLLVKAEELADGMVSTLEDRFIMIRLLQEPSQLRQQLRPYRNYIELLFVAASDRD